MTSEIENGVLSGVGTDKNVHSKPQDVRWILLVDDSSTDIRCVDYALRKANRSESLAAFQDPRPAIAKVTEDPNAPKLIVLDGRLGMESGVDFTKELRALPFLEYVPIVILTDNCDPKIVRGALDAGANAFVQKSMDFIQSVRDLETIFRFWLDLNCSL